MGGSILNPPSPPPSPSACGTVGCCCSSGSSSPSFTPQAQTDTPNPNPARTGQVGNRVCTYPGVWSGGWVGWLTLPLRGSVVCWNQRDAPQGDPIHTQAVQPSYSWDRLSTLVASFITQSTWRGERGGGETGRGERDGGGGEGEQEERRERETGIRQRRRKV